jgi:hypothetical protein
MTPSGQARIQYGSARYQLHAGFLLSLLFSHENGSIILLRNVFLFRLYGLVVRVPGYRSRGPGSIPRLSEELGLERGPLSLVSTTEELLERKSSGSCLENRDYGRRGSAALTTRHHSILKSWH